jgi:hypothetical protein
MDGAGTEDYREPSTEGTDWDVYQTAYRTGCGTIILEGYPLDRNFGIPGPFGQGNRLPTCKYLAMQPQLCRGGLGAL